MGVVVDDLTRLPPKLVEVDDTKTPCVVLHDCEDRANEGLQPRIERVRASIQAAMFTGKGDREKVVKVYHDYAFRISNAIASAGSHQLRSVPMLNAISSAGSQQLRSVPMT